LILINYNSFSQQTALVAYPAPVETNVKGRKVVASVSAKTVMEQLANVKKESAFVTKSKNVVQEMRLLINYEDTTVYAGTIIFVVLHVVKQKEVQNLCDIYLLNQ